MAGRPAALEDENIVASVMEESTRCKCFQSNADQQNTKPGYLLSMRRPSRGPHPSRVFRSRVKPRRLAERGYATFFVAQGRAFLCGSFVGSGKPAGLLHNAA